MLDLILLASLFLVGYFAGRWNENRHYRSLKLHEGRLRGVLIFSNRFPPDPATPQDSRLVCGSVVISDDYFKGMVAMLHSFFGGRVRSYESLLDRARREAVVRMKQEAHATGAQMIVNVKFQTFAIGGRNPGSVKGVEVLAYGTALAPWRTAPAPWGTALGSAKT